LGGSKAGERGYGISMSHPTASVMIRFFELTPFRGLWELREKDPLDTLKLILIQVLCHFFHWMLQKMSDTLRTVSSLQMYINPTACQRD
jgi:hypothetical protein